MKSERLIRQELEVLNDKARVAEDAYDAAPKHEKHWWHAMVIGYLSQAELLKWILEIGED